MSSMSPLQMVDLRLQYERIKSEIDDAIQKVLNETHFINGPQVDVFRINLENYLDVRHVIPCANGTDALQLAFMALELQPDDEVIIPAFTYVATAEVIALLKLKPVMVDVDIEDFNINVEAIRSKISPKTRAIVPVHLFGQSAKMEAILALAKEHNLYVIEDNAQAIGADYYYDNGSKSKLGTIGHIGTTSFFPSKNLGGYGDGGAVMTNDDTLAEKIKMMANHGQSKKYYHESIGCNSRLDTLQAAILDVKLKYLDNYRDARNVVANYYDTHLSDIVGLTIPHRNACSNHVFHQYTLQIHEKRDALKAYLQSQSIPSMIYYPLPLYRQEAYRDYEVDGFMLTNSEWLCKNVLSLPIHTEMTEEQMHYIVSHVKIFFNQ